MAELGSLEHYGVVGMRWGQRNSKPDISGVSRNDARQQIKTQNRERRQNLKKFKSRPRKTKNKLIKQARANTLSAERKYEDIKLDLKDQRSAGSLGRNAARVALNKAKNERYENAYKATTRTLGEQFVQALFEPRLYITRT